MPVPQPQMRKDTAGEWSPGQIPYESLILATNNFSEERIIGRGGFGPVYRGFLREQGRDVAIKKLSHMSHQGMKQYESEVEIITKVRHPNLVKLVGWCDHHGDLMLVYEFVPCGSLDTHLFKGWSRLNWPTRYEIVLGLASALRYLHEHKPSVLHRDIKSNNILLDCNFNVKLADFGLAMLFNHDMSCTQVSHPTGTFGYRAPEYAMAGKASKRSDVYSFGVVALEIACGKKALFTIPAIGGCGESETVQLLEWVWHLYGKGAILDAVDERLNGDFVREEMKRLLMVGLWCAHPHHMQRPTVRQAMEALLYLETTQVPDLPTKMPPWAYSEGPELMLKLQLSPRFSSPYVDGSAISHPLRRRPPRRVPSISPPPISLTSSPPISPSLSSTLSSPVSTSMPLPLHRQPPTRVPSPSPPVSPFWSPSSTSPPVPRQLPKLVPFISFPPSPPILKQSTKHVPCLSPPISLSTSPPSSSLSPPISPIVSRPTSPSLPTSLSPPVSTSPSQSPLQRRQPRCVPSLPSPVSPSLSPSLLSSPVSRQPWTGVTSPSPPVSPPFVRRHTTHVPSSSRPTLPSLSPSSLSPPTSRQPAMRVPSSGSPPMCPPVSRQPLAPVRSLSPSISPLASRRPSLSLHVSPPALRRTTVHVPFPSLPVAPSPSPPRLSPSVLRRLSPTRVYSLPPACAPPSPSPPLVSRRPPTCAPSTCPLISPSLSPPSMSPSSRRPRTHVPSFSTSPTISRQSPPCVPSPSFWLVSRRPPTRIPFPSPLISPSLSPPPMSPTPTRPATHVPSFSMSPPILPSQSPPSQCPPVSCQPPTHVSSLSQARVHSSSSPISPPRPPSPPIFNTIPSTCPPCLFPSTVNVLHAKREADKCKGAV